MHDYHVKSSTLLQIPECYEQEQHVMGLLLAHYVNNLHVLFLSTLQFLVCRLHIFFKIHKMNVTVISWCVRATDALLLHCYFIFSLENRKFTGRHFFKDKAWFIRVNSHVIC